MTNFTLVLSGAMSLKLINLIISVIIQVMMLRWVLLNSVVTVVLIYINLLFFIFVHTLSYVIETLIIYYALKLLNFSQNNCKK